MAEITKEQFKVVGKNTKTMESISRPNIGYWQDAWRRIRKNKIAFFSLCLIGLYVLMAIFVPMFSKYDIATQSVAEMNQSFSKAHWFGTDSLGRDLWVRAWSGARVSLTIGFAASIINAIVGSIMGGISGFYGGKIDMVIQRVVDVLYGIPSLIVTILLMVVVGNGVHCLILAMCCVGWIGGCRFVRGEVLKLRESDFVSAAKILGVPDIVIIVKHILPNIMGLIITNLTMAIPGAMMVWNNKKRLVAQSQPLRFHRRSNHLKGLSRSHTVCKQRIVSIHNMCYCIQLVRLQLHIRCHSRKLEM